VEEEKKDLGKKKGPSDEGDPSGPRDWNTSGGPSIGRGSSREILERNRAGQDKPGDRPSTAAGA